MTGRCPSAAFDDTHTGAAQCGAGNFYVALTIGQPSLDRLERSEAYLTLGRKEMSLPLIGKASMEYAHATGRLSAALDAEISEAENIVLNSECDIERADAAECLKVMNKARSGVKAAWQTYLDIRFGR